MGDTEWERFDEADVSWVPFDAADPTPAVDLVRAVLGGNAGGSIVRIEGPEPPAARGLLGRRKRVPRAAAQVVAGRHGAPIVLTVGEETEEPVGRRFSRVGIELPDGWSYAAAEGTFPWIEAPAATGAEDVVRFVVASLAALGPPVGQWRAGIDTPRMVEHSHGPEGTHTHLPGEHHH